MNIQKIFEDAKSSDEVPELILSLKRPKGKKRKIDTTEKQVEILREIFDPNTFEIQEELVLLILDDFLNLVCYYRLAKGDAGQVGISYKNLFGLLVSLQPDAFILAHNHPHRVCFPSYNDIEANHGVMVRASMFEMSYLDSIIIGNLEETEDEDPGYYSLADNGLFYGGDFP